MCKQASPCTRSSATYQANYDSAKGELAKSEAAAAIAHLTVQTLRSARGYEIHQPAGSTTRGHLLMLVRPMPAVIAAKPQSESARINLIYQYLPPISGRIGKSTVTEGTLPVTNGQTTELATVQQLPILSTLM